MLYSLHHLYNPLKFTLLDLKKKIYQLLKSNVVKLFMKNQVNFVINALSYSLILILNKNFVLTIKNYKIRLNKFGYKNETFY
jgi:hypothetical protein